MFEIQDLSRLIIGLLVHAKNNIKLIGDKSLSKRDFLESQNHWKNLEPSILLTLANFNCY